MTTEEFLGLLRERHIQVQAVDGRLKVSAPAGVIDELLKAALKDRKTALLGALSRATVVAEAGAQMVPLTAAALSRGVALTPAQQGMWLIEHFNPGSVAYNIPEAFRFEQAIELETIQLAVDQLIARHSILRTSFHEDDGDLIQTTAARSEARVGFTDMSSLPDAESDRECRRLIRSEGRRAFDLTQAPLARFHLFRLADLRHVVFLNVHHIIADRVSLYVLREELVALIQAAQRGSDAMLPTLQLQFPDYAAWVAKQMKSEAIERQIGYWKKKLADLPECLELPHSRPRPEKRSSWGATRQVFVSTAARSALNRIGMEEGASPFMTSLATFAVTVAAWSQEAGPQEKRRGAVDFCIGSPMTHRRDAATQRMIGPFVNMLAFRCTVATGMSFRDVLRQMRGTALEAYENSDVPFQRLVRAINPDRRSQRSPIFQVMFGYETYLAPVANEFQMDADPGTARYDLSLHLSETANEGLTGTIEYSTDLFEDADIERLAAVSERVLKEILRDPECDLIKFAPMTGVAEETTESPSNMPLEAGRLRTSAKGGVVRKLARFFSSPG